MLRVLVCACHFICYLVLGLVSPNAVLFAQRELTDIPVPNPDVELSTFQMGDGWKATLFAGDPSLAKPIHMNWDHQGRLWVASSETYPQVKPGEPANDKIVILEDSNHDGVADRTIVFADKLLIPTGVLPANDGPHASAYVANSDQLLYLVDRDGDLVADERTVVLSGFGTEDTHHLLHSLRWGQDGWLYMNQSIYIHSHIETPWGVERLNGGGIWRFHPATKRLEVYARGFVNTWGTHFDRYGQVFATDGAYVEGINFVFPGSVFVTAVGGERFVAGLNPGSPKHCGLEILSGKHWPESIRGSMVTNDFRAHRVCRFVVSESQSGYESVQQQEIIKTPHVSFRPIDAKQGLDGALYIADWYNPIIQHGEVDFRDPRRDRTHGRIWRVTHQEQKSAPNEAIVASDSIEKNMARLTDDSDLVRIFASQAIRVRAKSDPTVAARVQARIENLIQTSGTDSDLELLQWCWHLEADNQYHSAAIEKLLSSSDGRIRAAAVRNRSHQMMHDFRMSTGFGKEVSRDQKSKWLGLVGSYASDTHPRVRLEAVRLLAALELPEAAGAACEILNQPMDRFLDFALWQCMRDLKPSWLPAFQSGAFRFNGKPNAIAFALRAINEPSSLDATMQLLNTGAIQSKEDAVELMRLVSELGQPNQQGMLLDWIVRPESASKLPNLDVQDQAGLLRSLVDVSKRKKQPVAISPELNTSLMKLLVSKDTAPVVAVEVVKALGQWQVQEAREKIVDLVENGPLALRSAAIQAIASYADAQAKLAISKLAISPDSGIAIAATEQLVELDLNQASQTLADRLAGLRSPDAALSSSLQLILTKKAGSESLMNALGGKKLTSDVGRAVRSVLRSSGNASVDLIATIDRIASLSENKWVWSESLRDEWLHLAKDQGDARRGEMIYRRNELQCSQCHRIAGAGGVVGPELTSIGANAPADYLIEALIAPAAKVKEGYHAKLIRTDEDEVISGIPVRESDTEVILRTADGKERAIVKANIEESKDSRSLMPDGLLDSLSRDEAIDLVRFMTELGKIDGSMLVVADGSLRSWQYLQWTKEANQILNRNSLDAVSGASSSFTWLATSSLVSGVLPLKGMDTFSPHSGVPPTTFIQTQLTISKAGALVLDFGKAPKEGISLWINSVPTTITGDGSQFDVQEGPCIITLGINRAVIEDSIQVRVDSKGSTAGFSANSPG
jgi:putative heme-binding domain-containing protein